MDQSFHLISAQVQFMVSSCPPLKKREEKREKREKMARLRSLTTIVEVQEDRLALVHIPLELYPYFLKPILQVLFHEVVPLDDNTSTTTIAMEEDGGVGDVGENNDGEDGEDEKDDIMIKDEGEQQPAFLNISITPVECSVMCPRELAEKYFAPLVEQFAESEALSITKDDFIAMQVYGEGLEAGQRVLELTSPLAMAGM